MKEPIHILCFGDSNTWGHIPNTNHQRFDRNDRYPTILNNLLGKKYEIISEGLSGRTLVSEDKRPGKEGRNGNLYLIPCLDSHDPIALVVLMLGTNELQSRYNKSATDVGSILEKEFVKIILSRPSRYSNKCPKLIIVSPPIVIENNKSKFKFTGANKKSIALSRIYKDIAKRNNCYFIDTSDLEVGSDGLHLIKESHKELAKRLFEMIKKIRF
jgi:lysophospholipase L1-like esterase